MLCTHQMFHIKYMIVFKLNIDTSLKDMYNKYTNTEYLRKEMSCLSLETLK